MNTTVTQSALVTGASGFIGGHLARRLTAGGWRVACMIRATSRVEVLRDAGAQLITGDIHDHASIVRAIAVSEARVVFHLAGLVRATSAAAFLRTNEGGSRSVAAACAGQKAPPVLVMVSSLAAAGPSGAEPGVEGDPPSPVSHYGRSKLAGESAVAEFAGVVPMTIVRPGVVYGPGDRGVYELIKLIARYGIHVVPGCGDGRLSIVAVSDLVECLVLAAEKGERLAPIGAGTGLGLGEVGRGIYFASAEDYSYIELGGAIARALGKTGVRNVRLPGWSLRMIGRLGDAVSYLRRSPGWVGQDKIADMLAGSWVCSSAKARRQLGWSPALSQSDGLRDTVEWYRDAGWL